MEWLLIVYLNVVNPVALPTQIEFQTKELCDTALPKVVHAMEAGKGLGVSAYGVCIQVVRHWDKK